jgi:hypothetical protein
MNRTPEITNAINEILGQISSHYGAIAAILKAGGDEFEVTRNLRWWLGRIMGLLEIAMRLEPDNVSFRSMCKDALEQYTDVVVLQRTLKVKAARGAQERIAKLAHGMGSKGTEKVTLH